MKTVVTVLGEGLAGYTRSVGGGLGRAGIGLVALGFRLMFGMTMLFAILAVLFALVVHSWIAWHMAFTLIFWNVVLYLVRHFVLQAMAGRFRGPGTQLVKHR